MFKKIFLILTIIFLIIGCSNMPVKNPICQGQDSWICEKSHDMEVEPEHIYGWIYSATALATITDIVQIKEICDFEQMIANWYIDVYPISYDSVIEKIVKETNLIKDPNKALLVKNILNKNLIQYSSNGIIKPADDEILRKGHVKFRKDMLCN